MQILKECVIEREFVAVVRQRGGVAIKLQILGWRGWPDRLVITAAGRIFFVETKAVDGRLRPSQQRVHELLRRLHADVYVVRTSEEIKACLES